MVCLILLVATDVSLRKGPASRTFFNVPTCYRDSFCKPLMFVSEQVVPSIQDGWSLLAPLSSTVREHLGALIRDDDVRILHLPVVYVVIYDRYCACDTDVARSYFAPFSISPQ